MLKKLGTYALGACFVVAIFAVPLLFIKGALWASERVLQPLIDFGWWTLGGTLVLALPLSISKRLRGAMAVAILYSSFVYGLIAWLTGFVITYMHWGVFGVVIGLFFFGVGVVPIGMLASAFNGWDGFVPLLVLVVLTFGSRIVAFMLAASADKHRSIEPRRPLSPAEEMKFKKAFEELSDSSGSEHENT